MSLPLRAHSSRTRPLVVAGAIFMLILIGGWKAPDRAARKKNPVSPTEESLKVGKQLYVRECQDCHGSTGKGDGPAARDMPEIPDLSLAKVQKQSDGEFFYKITTGRKPMPAAEKTLTEEQRWHVINYVRGLARGDVANR